MEPNVYVISLDAVDLNLLPITHKASNDNVVPLWTRSNLDLRSNDYYEFKIVTNEDVEPQNKKTPVIEYVICDICDMDVPKVYFNEHKNCFKHKFNKKIADVALRRLQLYMNRQDDVDSENNETDPSTYFCPECSIIVDRKDEIPHRKSITHKHSVLLERFLRDFLQFYTNDDKLIEEKETVPESEIKIDNFEHDNTKKDEALEVTDKQLNKENFKKELSVLLTDTKVKKTDLIQDNTEKDKTPINTTDKLKKEIIEKDSPNPHKISISEYLKLLNNKFNTSPMFKAMGDEIEIKTIDGSKVRVPEDNFYAFLTIGSTHFCMICEWLVLEDYNVHLLSDQHMKLASLPLEDKHCLRKISNFKGHCLVCNVPFEHSITHTNYSNHKENLKKCLVFDNVKENDDKVVNDVNKKTAEPILKDASKATIASKGPETNKSMTENATASNQAAVNSDKTNHMLETFWCPSSDYFEQPGKRFCEFCNVWISVKKVKKHESTMKHHFNTISDHHYMLKILDTDILECKMCDVILYNTVDDIQKHFKSDEHIKMYNHILKVNNIKKLKGLVYSCTACNDIFLHKNEYLHIESKGHRIKINFVDDSLFEIFSKKPTVAKEAVKTEEAFVKTDFTEVNDTDATYAAVTKGTETTDAEVAKGTETTDAAIAQETATTDAGVAKKTDNVDVNIGNESGKTDEVTQNDNQKESPEPNYYFCEVCQVKVPSNENNIKIHNTGRAHLRKLDAFNTIKTTKEPAKEKLTTNLNYQIARIEKNVLICRLCFVYLTASEANISTHVEGASHLNNYNDFLKRNRLVDRNNEIYCSVCLSKTVIGYEFAHCLTSQHVDNLEQALPTWGCE